MKTKKEGIFENEDFLGALFIDPGWNHVLKNVFVERAIDHIVKVSDKMDILCQNYCTSVDDKMSCSS